MATILDKTITRDSGNIINTNTNYSELNTKASGLVNDIVSHVETQIQTTEAALQASENLVDAKIASLLSVGDTGYTKDVVDTNFANQINALAPYSGYTSVSKKLDNFVFQESTSFLNKVADKNRYVKFGDTVVDTYGDELVTNGDFSDGTTGWTTSNVSIINGEALFTSAGYSAGALASSTKNSFLASISLRNKSGTVQLKIGSSLGGSDIYIGDCVNGYNEFEFNTNVTNKYVTIGSTTGDVYFDNISVREIQTAQFQVPEVAEVITDGSNTTSVAVNAGDYVVDGTGELVTNGTFDTDVSGWTQSGSGTGVINATNGELNIPRLSDGSIYAEQLGIVCIPNVECILTVRLTDSINTLIRVGNGSSQNNAYVDTYKSAIGTHTFKFTPTTSIFNITFGTQADNTTSKVDNISVHRVSDTFRAIQDAPVGTALTNTTYFQDRTDIGVTNQQLSYHAYNTVTNAYEGIKTETLFTDVSKEDLLDNSAWMSANGFSKVSQFLYSKGSYLVLPVGIWQSLNKGAYHPVFNPFGTALIGYVVDGVTPVVGSYWYLSTSYKLTSTSDSFVYMATSTARDGSITTTNDAFGRPDSKYYDICYSDQFTDVREYAKILNKYEVAMIIADKEENGVEEAVNLMQVQEYTPNYVDSTTGNINTDSAYGDVTYLVIELGLDYVYAISDSGSIMCGYVSDLLTPGVPALLRGASVLIDNGNGSKWKLLYTRTKPILSSNTKLSIDLIGDPDNYPQIMKDRLASGVGVVGINPLLVGQDGTSYVSTTATFNAILSNKSIGDLNLWLYSSAPDVWNLGALTIDSVKNEDSTLRTDTYMSLKFYTSKNQPYIQTTPKPVIDVEPKTIASNSHSIYKGALVGNQVAGKVQVGQAYESKMLENADIVSTIDLDTAVNASAWLYAEDKRTLALKVGDTVYIDGTARTVATAPYYEYSSAFGKDVYRFTITETITPTLGANISFALSTPQHSTIALDNANSPASKWFNALSQGDNGVVGSVYGEELVYNSATSSYDGDDDEFEQLTNGTVTDLNGNTTRTFVGHLPINGEVK